MRREVRVVSYYDTVSYHVKLETLVANTSYTYICIEILQNIKYDKIMILLNNTMYCRGGIIN
jgi:hypothetical protein